MIPESFDYLDGEKIIPLYAVNHPMEKSVTDETLPVIGQRFRGFLLLSMSKPQALMRRLMPYWKFEPYLLCMMQRANLPGEARRAHINPFEGANLQPQIIGLYWY